MSHYQPQPPRFQMKNSGTSKNLVIKNLSPPPKQVIPALQTEGKPSNSKEFMSPKPDKLNLRKKNQDENGVHSNAKCAYLTRGNSGISSRLDEYRKKPLQCATPSQKTKVVPELNTNFAEGKLGLAFNNIISKQIQTETHDAGGSENEDLMARRPSRLKRRIDSICREISLDPNPLQGPSHFPALHSTDHHHLLAPVKQSSPKKKEKRESQRVTSSHDKIPLHHFVNKRSGDSIEAKVPAPLTAFKRKNLSSAKPKPQTRGDITNPNPLNTSRLSRQIGSEEEKKEGSKEKIRFPTFQENDRSNRNGIFLPMGFENQMQKMESSGSLKKICDRSRERKKSISESKSPKETTYIQIQDASDKEPKNQKSRSYLPKYRGALFAHHDSVADQEEDQSSNAKEAAFDPRFSRKSETNENLGNFRLGQNFIANTVSNVIGQEEEEIEISFLAPRENFSENEALPMFSFKTKERIELFPEQVLRSQNELGEDNLWQFKWSLRFTQSLPSKFLISIQQRICASSRNLTVFNKTKGIILYQSKKPELYMTINNNPSSGGLSSRVHTAASVSRQLKRKLSPKELSEDSSGGSQGKPKTPGRPASFLHGHPMVASSPFRDKPSFGLNAFARPVEAPSQGSKSNKNINNPVNHGLSFKSSLLENQQLHQNPSIKSLKKNQISSGLMLSTSTSGKNIGSMAAGSIERAGETFKKFGGGTIKFQIWTEFIKLVESNKDFTVPILPKGQKLNIIMYKNWGSPNEIGFSSLAMFDEQGDPIDLSLEPEKFQVKMYNKRGEKPSRVTTTQEFPHRFGVSVKNEDKVKISSGDNVKISIRLPTEKRISMIHFENYDESRHLYDSGVKELAVYLNGTLIFFGEMSPKSVDDTLSGTEYILFTKDETLLRLIQTSLDEEGLLSSEKNVNVAGTSLIEGTEERPMTRTGGFGAHPQKIEGGFYDGATATLSTAYSISGKNQNPTHNLIQGRRIKKKFLRVCLKILSGWSPEAETCGISGVEFYNGTEKVSPDFITVSSNSQGIFTSLNSERNLLTENNAIKLGDPQKQWQFVPKWLDRSGVDQIEFVFSKEQSISHLKIFNLNSMASEEDEFCPEMRRYNKRNSQTFSTIENGCKEIHISMVMQSPGGHLGIEPATSVIEGCIFLRKGIDTRFGEEGQTITLNEIAARVVPQARHSSSSEAEMGSSHPSTDEVGLKYNGKWLLLKFLEGFTLEFELLQTWGDQHYIGLDGLEVIDELGENVLKIVGEREPIKADPRSVQVLNHLIKDDRVPEKLASPRNFSQSDEDCWLAPFVNQNSCKTDNLGRIRNKLCVAFRKPVKIHSIVLWNYSKTPERGVKEFRISLDGALIYHVPNILAKTNPK